jgi:hypothetical protein
MMTRHSRFMMSVVASLLQAAAAAHAADIIPPRAALKTDRPRLLLRPTETPLAISLAQLQALTRDAEFKAALDRLRRQKSAMAQAMLWRLTGDADAANRAIARMRAYDNPKGQGDAFAVYFGLRRFALAYDWLHGFPGFTKAVRAEIREKVAPLAKRGLTISDDHLFHNYVWMSAGGACLWALATAGDDDAADALYDAIRDRLNDRLYPGWKYLDGLPGESQGYWALYDLSPGALVLIAAQSATETDLMAAIRTDGDWLRRQHDYLIHVTTPAMKYLTWGDSRWDQPDNGVTHEMAGVSDAITWALRSPTGAWFSRWMADGPRGMKRFYGETIVFYFLYTRHITTKPETPPLSALAGGRHGGHFIARSSWKSDATLVGFRCTDHYGDHNHHDQGSFVLYRKGLLATDPPHYPKVRGPQQRTEFHNTLLVGGAGQRPVRGQWFATLAKFKQNLTAGRTLETGDILFHKESDGWAAVSGQFAQAYPAGLLKSCVRQVLFVRPSTVVIVDRLATPKADPVPVEWLLMTPKRPTLAWGQAVATNGKSWLRCRPVHPGPAIPKIEATPVNAFRAAYRYEMAGGLTLVHVRDVGDGTRAGKGAKAAVRSLRRGLELRLGPQRFVFGGGPGFAVREETGE